jgi:hypothetical protein
MHYIQVQGRYRKHVHCILLYNYNVKEMLLVSDI